jgi:glycosyltransferase involved in cell wall biosynthesis
VIDPTSPRPSPPPRGGEGDEAKARASMGPARRLTVLSVAYPFAPVGPDAVGGAEQILSELDRMLVEAGHRSLVIACEGSRTRGELIAHPAPEGDIDQFRRADTHAAVREAISQTMQCHPVDLVHLHGVDFPAYLPPPGPPCLITLHLPPESYHTCALDQSRPNTWFHCVSARQQRAFPPSDAMLPPIPNGVPVDALSAHRHARRSYALTLGRICPEKGQHLALRAAHQAGVALLLAGTVFPYPVHEAYFAEQIVPLLDNRRRWIGAIGFDRKRRLLSAARCLLVPSLIEETASLVAMEALACGTPVIAFPAGALRELVEPGITGFLVHDEAEMAEAIGRAGDIDPAACRRIARERYSLERMTDAYLSRYAELT